MYTTKQWKKFYNKQTRINAKICKLIEKREANYRKYYEEHGKEWLKEQEAKQKTELGAILHGEPYLSGDYNRGEHLDGDNWPEYEYPCTCKAGEPYCEDCKSHFGIEVAQ